MDAWAGRLPQRLLSSRSSALWGCPTTSVWEKQLNSEMQHYQVSLHPLSCAPLICSSIRPNAIYNQTHPDDDNALAVLSCAIAHVPSSERSALSPPFPFLVSSLTTRDSCRRPHELWWCPGGSSDHDELLPSTSGAGAPTLAHAARQVRQEARRRQSVTVQMKNVANSQPVHKA